VESPGRQDALGLVEAPDNLVARGKLERRPGVARQLALET
jgi:hypothetical protein